MNKQKKNNKKSSTKRRRKKIVSTCESYKWGFTQKIYYSIKKL